jgi:antitoxin MazE
MTMSAAVRTRIVKIGNSQGIRIPRILLEQSGVGEEIEIEVQDQALVIRAAAKSRRGWEAAFANPAEGLGEANPARVAPSGVTLGADLALKGDPEGVLWAELPGTAWDETEWEW